MTSQRIEYVEIRDALDVIAATSWHLRDQGLLDSALARPSSVVFGLESYAGLHLKAAALMDAVARAHPLLDGNKRLSLDLTGLFYWLNGVVITADDDPLVEFVLTVAGDHVPLEKMAEWLEQNTARRETRT